MNKWKQWADVPKGVLVKRKTRDEEGDYLEWFIKVDDMGGFVWGVEDGGVVDFVLSDMEFIPGDNDGGKFKEVDLVTK